MLVLAGCGGGSADDNSDSGNDAPSEFSSKEIAEFDEEVQQLLEKANQKSERKPTTFDNIQEALDAGDITEEQSVLLTYLAIFDDEKLPSQYSGDDPEVFGDSALMAAEWWLEENWDTLDEDTQEALYPFYAPPDDPDSYFNPANENKKAEWLEALELIPGVSAEDYWDSVDFILSVNPRKAIFVFYPKGNTALKQKAVWINESLTKAWPMYEGLFAKYPDQTIFLYLTDTGNVYGTAKIAHLVNKDRCLIKIGKGFDKKTTQATATHELFHCFQFYVPMKYDEMGRRWMMEATATWSEDWVWPEYNTEWEYLGNFFNSLEMDMILWDRSREYSTYPWYKFLTQYSGGPSIVYQSLFEAHNKPGRQAFKNIDYYETLWAEFALWNWNQDPEMRYSDSPSFPAGTYKGKKMDPNGDSYKGKIYDTKKENKESLTLGSVSMAYRAMVFTDDIDKVVVKFEKDGDDLHRRQALIKIGDIWHWEDWTEIEERKFCRTRDDEKVLAIVLIVSDAVTDESENHKEKYTVDTRGKCNPEWRGTTTWQFSFMDEWQVLYAQTVYSKMASMRSYDTLVMDEDEGEFVIKDQFVTYYYREEQSTTFAQNCGMLHESMIKRQAGSAGRSFEINERYPSDSDAPTRLEMDYDDPFLYDVDIDAHDFDYDWLSYTDTRSSRRKACELEGIFAPGPGSYGKSDTDFSRSDRFMTEPNDIQAKMNIDGDRIYGQETQMWSHGDSQYPVMITVDYRYQ